MPSLENKLFFCGLGTSLFIHLSLIVGLTVAASRLPVVVKPARTIELTYLAPRKESRRESTGAMRPVQVIKHQQLPSSPPVDVKALSKDDAFSSLKDSLQEATKTTQMPELKSQKASPVSALGYERMITVPMLQSEKISDPRYLSYTQNIRQRIKQRAYFYADHPDFQSGEVYLTFVLASSGVLEGVKIIKEKTSANEYVQQIGVRSIEESAPFPPFPPDFNFPELTFNVIISFELSR